MRNFKLLKLGRAGWRQFWEKNEKPCGPRGLPPVPGAPPCSKSCCNERWICSSTCGRFDPRRARPSSDPSSSSSSEEMPRRLLMKPQEHVVSSCARPSQRRADSERSTSALRSASSVSGSAPWRPKSDQASAAGHARSTNEQPETTGYAGRERRTRLALANEQKRERYGIGTRLRQRDVLERERAIDMRLEHAIELRGLERAQQCVDALGERHVDIGEGRGTCNDLCLTRLHGMQRHQLGGKRRTPSDSASARETQGR